MGENKREGCINEYLLSHVKPENLDSLLQKISCEIETAYMNFNSLVH